MASDASSEARDCLPADWREHVDVERDGISLKVRGEHFPRVAFLYEDGASRDRSYDAVCVTNEVRRGLPYDEVSERARSVLLKRAAARAKARTSS